jgi:hypothetical protein
MEIQKHDIRRVCFAGFVLAATLLNVAHLCAQKNDQNLTTWEFLPPNTLVRPFPADHQEPRLGLRKELGSSKMKLDIGGMLDMVEMRFGPGGKHHLRAGMEFFTYALTTSEEGLRLQVDAVDGFFGGYLCYRSSIQQPYVSVRLRFIHHSSHFVDGHLLPDGVTWRDNRPPVPLAQDFFELTFAHTGEIGNCTLTPYIGGSYAVLSRPPELKRLNGLAGLVFYVRTQSGGTSAKPVILYIADHFNLSGYNVYVGTNNAEAGLKFGNWEDPGVRIYFGYHSGREIFSQYYDVIRAHWGVGFAVDIW